MEKGTQRAMQSSQQPNMVPMWKKQHIERNGKENNGNDEMPDLVINDFCDKNEDEEEQYQMKMWWQLHSKWF